MMKFKPILLGILLLCSCIPIPTVSADSVEVCCDAGPVELYLIGPAGSGEMSPFDAALSEESEELTISDAIAQQQEIARNIFLNLDHRATEDAYTNVNYKFSNKGWRVHTESWTDANVLDSLRGKIISKKEICNNTFETLSSVILHLIQSGVQMELNYDLIEKFIENNKPPQYQEIFDISNKEKKFLDKHVDGILKTFDI